MRDFLWCGMGEDARDHLVKWEVCCLYEEESGVEESSVLNLFLMGKWLWQFPFEPSLLRHRLVKSKFVLHQMSRMVRMPKLEYLFLIDDPGNLSHKCMILFNDFGNLLHKCIYIFILSFGWESFPFYGMIICCEKSPLPWDILSFIVLSLCTTSFLNHHDELIFLNLFPLRSPNDGGSLELMSLITLLDSFLFTCTLDYKLWSIKSLRAFTCKHLFFFLSFLPLSYHKHFWLFTLSLKSESSLEDES